MTCRYPITACTLALVISPVTASAVNFTEDVAPIIFQNCTSCHRPGEAAPFAFTTYEQVRKRARMIAEVVEEGVMPPWHAEKADVSYQGERHLTEKQIATLAAWAEAGAPQGDASKTPTLPEYTEGWQLGEPDLVVEMSQEYEIPASGPDVYRNFVIGLDLDEDKWVKAIEFRPGSPSVVHHSLFFFDTSGEARREDERSTEPGFSRMGRFAREGGLGAWAAGGQPKPLPDDLAYRLPKGADLILSTHFHPSGKLERERSRVGIFFAERAPRRSFTGIQLPPHFGATSGVDIPAGESNYVKRDSFELPVAVRAFGVSAHAHYLGKTMNMTAVLPNGERRVLLDIRAWDFDWQEDYMLQEFYDLPKGTRIESEVVWDNSAENPHNPNDPPRRVKWGRESGDEMGSITLLVVAQREQEMAKLERDYKAHSREFATRRLREARDQRRQQAADPAAEKGGFESIPKAVVERHKARFDRDRDGELNDEEKAAALAAWRRWRNR